MHQRSRIFFMIFTVLWSVAVRTVVGQGGDCSPLVEEDLGDFDSLNQTGLISAALPSQPEVQLLNYTIVCVAQGTMRDTWRIVSGVATYMLAGGMNDTVQFHFQCEDDGSAWNTTIMNSTDFVLTSPNATFDTPRRTDCALCISPEQLPEADNDQHCVSCASECNVTGLMRCTSPASTDCCTLFGPEGQCVNESSCPGNSVASDLTFDCICPSNYTGANCMIDVNECDELGTNPCENGANCTNTNGGFMCDCPLEYTGVTCEETIEFDNCIPNPCLNGGECSSGFNEFMCNCTADWNGTICDLCTLENCANCTTNENQSFAAICVQCEDGYQLENETCRPVCQVEGCANCSQSSSTICEECDNELIRAQDGSSCSALTTPPSPSPSTSMTTSAATNSGNNTGRLAGIVVGSVVGGMLLVVVVIAAIVYWRRKKSRVTLKFDLDTLNTSHVTANPVFEDIHREDSGIENDDEIVVNKGALEFDDD